MPNRLDNLFALLALAALLMAGCDTSGPPKTKHESNVRAQVGATVNVTSEAVAVNDDPVIQFGNISRALFVGHAITYEYGTPNPETLMDEQWFMRFRHRIRPFEQGDTLVFHYMDYGEVSVEGEAMRKLTDSPDTDHIPRPVEQINSIAYLNTTYAHRTGINGEETLFERAPFYEDVEAARSLSFTATGSEDIEPLRTSFSPHSYPTLTRMTNGAALDFQTTKPAFDASEPLVLTFDRPLDPSQTLLWFVPRRDSDSRPQGQPAVFHLQERSDRIVIDAAALQEMRGPAGDGEVLPYRLLISEFITDPSVVESVDAETGEHYALPFVQRNHSIFTCTLSN